MNLHSNEEIEKFLNDKIRNFESGYGYAFVGFIFISYGIMVGIVRLFGEGELASSLSEVMIYLISCVGILLMVAGYYIQKMGENESSSRSIRLDEYREVFIAENIVEAKIDHVFQNPKFSVNDVGKTTFYLNIDDELLQFSTFNYDLIENYKSETKMPVYYSSKFPSILVPYDLVTMKEIAEDEEEPVKSEKFSEARNYRIITMR